MVRCYVLIFECSSLALYERYEKKQGLSSFLYLKCSTSSCRYCDISEFFTSAKLNKGFDINQKSVSSTMQSLGHGHVGIEKFNTLMKIPKPVTVKTITKQFQK